MPDPTPEDRKEAEEIAVYSRNSTCTAERLRDMIAHALSARTEKVRQEERTFKATLTKGSIQNCKELEAKLAEKEGELTAFEQDLTAAEDETIRLTAEVGRLSKIVEVAKELDAVVFPVPAEGTAYYLNPEYLYFDGSIFGKSMLTLHSALSSPPAEPGAGA